MFKINLTELKKVGVIATYSPEHCLLMYLCENDEGYDLTFIGNDHGTLDGGWTPCFATRLPFTSAAGLTEMLEDGMEYEIGKDFEYIGSLE